MRVNDDLTDPAFRRVLVWLTGRELARTSARAPYLFGGNCPVNAKTPFGLTTPW
jgi:hypothetical protein